jgi:hypothetical protein
MNKRAAWAHQKPALTNRLEKPLNRFIPYRWRYERSSSGLLLFSLFEKRRGLMAAGMLQFISTQYQTPMRNTWKVCFYEGLVSNTIDSLLPYQKEQNHTLRGLQDRVF